MLLAHSGQTADDRNAGHATALANHIVGSLFCARSGSRCHPMHFGGSDDCSSSVLEAHMVHDRIEEVVVRQKQPRSTAIPNIVFAICMVAFIAFIFWQYGMRDNPSLA